MKKNIEVETKYKLYRTVKEILHPTISKRNISNYRIILSDELLPIQVFYPKKVSNLEKVIIYINGNEEITECKEKYSIISKDLSLKTNSLLLLIDYDDTKQSFRQLTKSIYLVVKHIYDRLLENNIRKDRIILMGDSTAGSLILEINKMFHDKNPITKEVLFYPTLSLQYFGNSKYQSITQNQELNFNLIPKLKNYYTKILTKKDIETNRFNSINRDDSIPKTLIFVGAVDCVRDENKEYAKKHSKNCTYIELPFLSHGFLKRIEKEEEKIIIEKMIDFLNQ